MILNFVNEFEKILTRCNKTDSTIVFSENQQIFWYINPYPQYTKNEFNKIVFFNLNKAYFVNSIQFLIVENIAFLL